jgi:hypothetical protein
MNNRFFFNRRSGIDRRQSEDQRLNPRLDLSHKRRRKTDERRSRNRSSASDFYANNNFFMRKDMKVPPQKH